MQSIQYYLKTTVNIGTEERPVWEDAPGPACTMPYSAANLALAEREAFGEIAVEEDGQPEPLPAEQDVTLELLADHEYRLCMLELEGGNTV